MAPPGVWRLTRTTPRRGAGIGVDQVKQRQPVTTCSHVISAIKGSTTWSNASTNRLVGKFGLTSKDPNLLGLPARLACFRIRPRWRNRKEF